MNYLILFIHETFGSFEYLDRFINHSFNERWVFHLDPLNEFEQFVNRSIQKSISISFKSGYIWITWFCSFIRHLDPLNQFVNQPYNERWMIVYSLTCIMIYFDLLNQNIINWNWSVQSNQNDSCWNKMSVVWKSSVMLTKIWKG